MDQENYENEWSMCKRSKMLRQTQIIFDISLVCTIYMKVFCKCIILINIREFGVIVLMCETVAKREPRRQIKMVLFYRYGEIHAGLSGCFEYLFTG